MAEPVPWPRGARLRRGRGRAGNPVPWPAGWPWPHDAGACWPVCRCHPVPVPAPVANPARKRDHPPTRNLSEIPKLNFEFRF
jgi:hypothetical protein